MIQTDLDIDFQCQRGERPVFIFEDIHHLEAVTEFLQRLVKKYKENKTDRLEFFSDGIYLDGKRLELKGRQYAFLRLFEINDEVPILTITEKIWGDSFASRDAIASVVQRIQKSTGIVFEKVGENYRIFRP